jgi:hypothetical protein
MGLGYVEGSPMITCVTGPQLYLPHWISLMVRRSPNASHAIGKSVVSRVSVQNDAKTGGSRNIERLPWTYFESCFIAPARRARHPKDGALAIFLLTVVGANITPSRNAFSSTRSSLEFRHPLFQEHLFAGATTLLRQTWTA